MSRRPDRTDASSWALLTPVDLRDHELPRQAAFGFHRGRTEELLHRAAATIEDLNRQLAEVQEAKRRWKQEREELQGRLKEEAQRAERLVGEAMLDAHKAGQALLAETKAEAEALRAEAAALLEPAKHEAQKIVAEAREQSARLVADARAESKRLAAEADQHKLLAVEVQRRSITTLRRALQALGDDVAESPSSSGDEVAPFRTADHGQQRPGLAAPGTGADH